MTLAPALAGRSRPSADAAAVRQAAARLLSTAHERERSAQRVARVTASLSGGWRGDAAVSAVALLDDLRTHADQGADVHAEAASVLQVCATQVDEAHALWERAQALERQDATERAARTSAAARGAFVGPYEVDHSPLRAHARRLADKAHALAGGATSRAAAQLRALAALAPGASRDERAGLTAADQLRAVGPAAVEAVWGAATTIADLSLPRLVLDRDDWLEDVRALRDGAVHAKQHPAEAAAAIVGWDVLREGRYGEWVGSALPDAVSGVLSGGVVPVTRRTADVAGELADLAEDVDDLQRVHGRDVDLPVETGGPVEPHEGAPMSERYPGAVLDLEPGRRRHILDGDATGGGHRAGAGKGKSEFPADWSDDDIVRRVMETARRPERTRDQTGRPTMLAEAMHEGVEIAVVVAPSGRIITAYPVRGPGVRLMEAAQRAG